MDAPEAIKVLRATHPEVKIITFSGSGRPGALYASMRAGSSGWVNKTRAIQELRNAVLNVAAGRPVSNEEMESLPQTDQLQLHYQPIVALATGRIVGFEALVRWQDPERGLLHPVAFLPLAEETGFIVEIDRWAWRQAATQLSDWQQRLPSAGGLFMSVNMSVIDLSDIGLFESITGIIQDTGIDPVDLVIEVTESVLLDDTEQTRHFLQQLSDLGVGLALDDFGTAFSSLSYVRRFPFDHLKLDISFISELPHSIPLDAVGGGDLPPVHVPQDEEHCRGNRARRAGRRTARDGLRVRAGVPVLEAPPRIRLRDTPDGGEHVDCPHHRNLTSSSVSKGRHARADPPADARRGRHGCTLRFGCY